MNELYSPHFSVAESGILAMDGLGLPDIAKQFGTPCYVVSTDVIRENCRNCMDAMAARFGGRFRVSYASKALCAGFVYRILQEEGLCADVVSAGELYTALRAGFPAEKLHFNGNNKTAAEIDYALDCGIGAFVHDECNKVFGIDGNEEYMVYTAPVGTVRPEDKTAEAAFYKFVEEEGL